MSLRPIDLQTMFMQMSNVSKEQAKIKDKEAVKQSLEAKQLATEELTLDKGVNKTEEDKQDEKIRPGQQYNPDEKNKKQNNHLAAEFESSKEGYKTADSIRLVDVKDEDMGKNIDIET